MGNRILLADDSITIQKVVNLTFMDEGIEVIAVSNGDMAERRLAEVQPDLVLADIFMPGKNGYELCEAIKESAQFHHIPVVLLVGAFEPFDQAEARRVKADAHLTKPFESRTLVDTVRKLISANSQPRTGPLPPLPAPDARTAPAEPPMMPLTPALAEPRGTMPMAHPFNLDLPAMTIETAPPASPPAFTAAMPLNYTYGSSEDPLAVQMEVQVAEAPAPGEAVFAAQGDVLRKTDDLSFADSQPPFEALGLDDLFSEPQANPPMAATESAPAGFAETAHDSGFGVPSTFGYATEEMMLDFDQPTPAATRAAHEPFSFDIEEREAASVDATGMQVEDVEADPAAEERALQTTVLAPPQPAAPVESAINTNPLEMPAAQAPGEMPEPAFATDVESLADAALFNVDDPLGDVLDEGPVATVAPEAPAGDTLSGAAQTPAEEPPAGYEVEFPGAPPAETTAPAEPVSATDMPPAETAPADAMGFGFTPAVDEPEPVDRAAQATEVKFTTASMWTDEEARFAAIDIEATPVEEAAEAAVSEAPAEPVEAAVFDEDASAYITQPNRPVEVAPVEAVEPLFEPVAEPVAEEPAALTPPQEAPAAATVELSPALVDEIVRRVVAQLSESVVREIAWEVVPDCVERIIKDMAAQEMSKR